MGCDKKKVLRQLPEKLQGILHEDTVETVIKIWKVRTKGSVALMTIPSVLQQIFLTHFLSICAHSAMPMPQNKPACVSCVCCMRNDVYLRVVHKVRCLGLIINKQLTFSAIFPTIWTKVGRKIACLRCIDEVAALPTSSPPILPLCHSERLKLLFRHLFITLSCKECNRLLRSGGS